jgi:hypothetical protein
VETHAVALVRSASKAAVLSAYEINHMIAFIAFSCIVAQLRGNNATNSETDRTRSIHQE